MSFLETSSSEDIIISEMARKIGFSDMHDFLSHLEPSLDADAIQTWQPLQSNLFVVFRIFNK